MSQLQTKIIINGQDNASKAFKSAARSAMDLREGVQELAGSLTRFFGLSATVGSFTVFGKASLDAALNLDRLNKAFSTIEGSSARGAARLDYLREISDKLGQNFYQTAEAAKGFFAATQGTQLEGQAEKIFESVTEASTALGLSSDEYNRTLLALQQMISKGKVSAEELRQQLGEALPSAFQLFAQAAGVSTAELDKMLERGEVGIDLLVKFADVLHNKYEKGAKDAAQGLQAELNRLKTSWEDFKVSFMDSDLAASSIQTLRGAVEGMTGGVEEYDTALKASVPALAAFIVQHKLMNSSLAQGDGIRKNVVAGLRNLTLASREAADAEMIRLEREKLVLVQSEKQAQAFLKRVEGTEKAGRAEQVLTSIRTRLLAVNTQLTNEEKKLSTRSLAAATSLGILTKAGLGVRNAFSGLLGIFGGPWGLAFTAAAGAVGYLVTSQDDAAKAAELHTKALDTLGKVLKGAQNETGELTRKLTELERQQLMASQKGLGKSYAQNLKDLNSELEQILHLQDTYLVTGRTAKRIHPESLIPPQYIDSLNGMLSLLQRGQMDVETFREELANLSNTASEAGYKNTYFVSTLEKLNNESSGLLSRLAESDKGLRDINAALEQSASMGDSAAGSTNRFSRELAALDKTGGKFVGSTSEAIAWLETYTGKTALAKESSAAFERAQREVAIAMLQSSAAVAAVTGDWEAYTRLMDASAKYLERFTQMDAEKGGSGKSDAQRKAEAARKALEGYNRELEKLKSTDAEFRNWELEHWIEQQIELYPQYKKKIEEVAAARRESWAEEDRAEAERKAREDSDVRLDFYQQLAEKSGQYNLSLEYANQLIGSQMKEWENAKIPQEYLDQMRELLRLEASTDGWDGAMRAMKRYYADATNMGRQFENFTQTSLSSLEDALVDFTTTGKLSFSDFADSVIKDLVRMAYKAMVLAPLMQGITGMFGGGSVVSKALGASSAAISAITPSAQGNVFSGGGISDYSGSIVSSPTTFDFQEHVTAFRKGAGLMGEAGPEAVMPLTRGPDGILGVRAYTPEITMPTPEVTVNVINNTGQQVQAQTTATPDGQGGLNIEVVLDQLEAGMVQRDNVGRSRFANHLDRTRGLSRAGRLYRGRSKS